MTKPTLAELPTVNFPAGHTFRPATDADKPELVKVLDSAFPEFGWDDTKVDQQLLANAQVFETYVIERDGEPVASIGGVIRPSLPHEGYVHWVAVHPTARGMGLGYWATLALMHEFKKRNLTTAILDTDDYRLPAVKTYLKLGFEPITTEEGEEERWERVLAEIGR